MRLWFDAPKRRSNVQAERETSLGFVQPMVPHVALARLLTLVVMSAGVWSCNGASRQEPESNAQASNIAAVPDQCPEEELSCGRQLPVTSDGEHAFVNEAMGVRAYFPRGSPVCLSRSGDAPRGFYSWFGATRARCEQTGEDEQAYMGIDTSFNALSHSLEETIHRCRPLSGPVVRLLPGGNLAFPGHRSIACQEIKEAGTIELTVHTLAGRRPDAADGEPPAVHYRATLGTRPDRLERDLQMFRTFLHRLRIGNPG